MVIMVITVTKGAILSHNIGLASELRESVHRNAQSCEPCVPSFRNTYLRNYTECPEGLYKFWMGHAGKDMSDVYDKIKEDVPFPENGAERPHGYSLPRAAIGASSAVLALSSRT